MKLGQEHLAAYGSVKSRKDFTQRQWMSCLILKSYLKTSDRGLVDWLWGHAALRKVLGLEEKLPDYTALQKFSARPEVVARLPRRSSRGADVRRCAGRAGRRRRPSTPPGWSRPGRARIR
jgi:hypothetical protein